MSGKSRIPSNRAKVNGLGGLGAFLAGDKVDFERGSGIVVEVNELVRLDGNGVGAFLPAESGSGVGSKVRCRGRTGGAGSAVRTSHQTIGLPVLRVEVGRIQVVTNTGGNKTFSIGNYHAIPNEVDLCGVLLNVLSLELNGDSRIEFFGQLSGIGVDQSVHPFRELYHVTDEFLGGVRFALEILCLIYTNTRHRNSFFGWFYSWLR